MIEYTGPQALRYQQHFVEQMLHYASDGQPDVRQAAAYGLGVMGQHGGPEFAPGLPINLILLPLIFFFKITDLPRGPMTGIFVICPVHQLPPFGFRTFKRLSTLPRMLHPEHKDTARCHARRDSPPRTVSKVLMQTLIVCW